jgi:tetratricopeptide (TPR) repeat protein
VGNQWFEERKDLFFKDLVHYFLESKLFFDELYHNYKKNEVVPFKQMDLWVGSEIKKGPLWNVKDNSHKLFRNTESKISLSEYLFDWSLGSIFHEGMKLKEDAYQLEVYLPSFENIDTPKKTEEIEEILGEYISVIEKATVNLDAEMESINYLFSKAVERLKELLVDHAHNGLLVRFLLENKELVEKALGTKSLQHLTSSLFPHHPERAYLIAGKSYLNGGWFKEAIHCFYKALEINPDYSEAKKQLQEAEHKLSPGGNT